MSETSSLTAAFVRTFQATFGERAREIAEGQRDAARSKAVRAQWGHIVELLDGESGSS